MAIKLLDEKLINKIAAGEVVERPASIVKELVENSLDAGAHRVEVRITGGGIESIEVSDDGEGIPEEDLPMAFLRHATSKIRSEQDLLNILTMGFRGEALPSILSVSRMEVYTRWASEPGIYARLEGGRFLAKHTLASPTGTKIIVRDLFFNTPARKKFLKTPVSEGNQVFEMVVRYAMARPDVAFTYSNDKRTYFKTPGNGSLRDAVSAIWGWDILQHMLDVDGSRTSYCLHGLVSSSEIRRQSRKNQIFFVNHRPVRSPLLFRSLDTAYKGLLLPREQPLAILNLTLPEGEVDVNVHPQKSEVRFRDEKKVFSTLVELVGEALMGMQVSPEWQKLDAGAGRVSFGPTRTSPLNSEYPAPSLWNKTSVAEYQERGSLWEKAPAAEGLSHEASSIKIIGQAFDAYIIIEKDQELWLIDQHAAHERVMYWRIKSGFKKSAGQVLALPLAIEFTTRQMEIMESKQDILRRLGFGLEPLGPNSMLVREAPSLLVGKEIEVLRELAESGENAEVDYEDSIAVMMACKKAVKAGMPLTHSEIKQIVQDLFSVPEYRFCPHGRPTMIKLSRNDLDRMFKRQ